MSKLHDTRSLANNFDPLLQDLVSFSAPLDYYRAIYYCESLSDLSEADNNLIQNLGKLKNFFLAIYLEEVRSQKAHAAKELTSLCNLLDIELADTDGILSGIQKVKAYVHNQG